MRSRAEREQRARRSPALAAQRACGSSATSSSASRAPTPTCWRSRATRGAARFFLDDLYGPRDFSERDAQFARIVPALVRLFPHEIVGTVQALAALHALSERLDSAMAARCHGDASMTRRLCWRPGRRSASRRHAKRQVAADAGGRPGARPLHPQTAAAAQPAHDARPGARGRPGRAADVPGERASTPFAAMRGAEEFLAHREQARAGTGGSACSAHAGRQTPACGVGQLP